MKRILALLILGMVAVAVVASVADTIIRAIDKAVKA